MLSELFLTVNYWLTIVSAIVGLPLCLLTIVIIITHRQCHNFTNLLSCNTCVAVTLFFIFPIIEATYAIRQDWQYHQPVCLFRAYCLLALCATLCYSYSIQAISRLFFAVFYKYKFLLTWRTHWTLIIVNWIVSMTLSIEPFFHQNGFLLQIESHCCTVNSKIVSVSIYVVVTVFVIPLNIVTIIYGVILYHVRQSTRRVTAHVKPPAANAKRDLKIMRNMLAQTSIISLGGILYLILVIWNTTQQQSAPESLYLLALDSIATFTAFMMIALFLMNKPVKKIALSYILLVFPSHMEQSMTHQLVTRFNVR